MVSWDEAGEEEGVEAEDMAKALCSMTKSRNGARKQDFPQSFVTL